MSLSICPALPPGASCSRGPARSGPGVAAALMLMPGQGNRVCSSWGPGTCAPGLRPCSPATVLAALPRVRVSGQEATCCRGPASSPLPSQALGAVPVGQRATGGARGRLALRGAGSAGETRRLCPRAMAALISGQLALHIIRVGQLDTFLEAVEKLPVIAYKGTRAKQSPVNCMKHSARIKAGVYITLQNIMEIEVIKYVNLRGYSMGATGEGGERLHPKPPGTYPRAPLCCPRELWGVGPAPSSLGTCAWGRAGMRVPGSSCHPP